MARQHPIPDGGDEPDGESRPDDPAEGLEPDIPEVPDPSENVSPDIPEAPDLSENDIDPDLRREFWSLVMLFNVALFGMSLGVMLVGFEGRWRVGGAIFAAGAVAFARGWRGYRQVTAETDDEE